MRIPPIANNGLQLDANGLAAPRRASLPVYPGSGGMVHGVNPLSNKAMLTILDDDTDPQRAVLQNARNHRIKV